MMGWQSSAAELRLQIEPIVRLLEAFSYLRKISSAVKNSIDSYLILLNAIIHGEWKPLGKKAVVPSKMDAMYSRKQPKGLDIRKHGFEKRGTYARFL
jgi:hypothetical protein